MENNSKVYSVKKEIKKDESLYHRLNGVTGFDYYIFALKLSILTGYIK
jgi:hypothetical protein